MLIENSNLLCYPRGDMCAKFQFFRLIWKKFDWDLYVHTKVDICAKFQLSSFIFIFISCQQLLSAVDGWWQLLQKKIYWNFHRPPKADACAKFQLCRLLGGLAGECDAGHAPRQAKLKLLRLSWADACAAPELSNILIWSIL